MALVNWLDIPSSWACSSGCTLFRFSDDHISDSAWTTSNQEPQNRRAYIYIIAHVDACYIEVERLRFFFFFLNSGAPQPTIHEMIETAIVLVLQKVLVHLAHGLVHPVVFSTYYSKCFFWVKKGI